MRCLYYIIKKNQYDIGKFIPKYKIIDKKLINESFIEFIDML